MTFLRVYGSMYGQDTFWLVASLGMLAFGLIAGYELGKEYRFKRDARGRFIK